MILYFIMAGAVMTKLRAPFAWYTSSQAQLEGESTPLFVLHPYVLTQFMVPKVNSATATPGSSPTERK